MIGVRLIVLWIVNAGSIPTAELCSEQSLIRFLNDIERRSTIVGLWAAGPAPETAPTAD